MNGNVGQTLHETWGRNNLHPQPQNNDQLVHEILISRRFSYTYLDLFLPVGKFSANQSLFRWFE